MALCLQIAQLQAQLTLQRLKLVQTAAGGAGGGTAAAAAAAASVLNQVLAGMPVSSPLLGQLRSSNAGGVPHGQLGSAFPNAPPGFPPLTSAGGWRLWEEVLGSAGLNQYRGSFPQTSLGLAAGSAFPSGSDRPAPYGYPGTPSSTASQSGDGQNAPSGAPARPGTRPGFRADLYGTCRPDTQPGFSGEHNRDAPKSGHPTGRQWDGAANFSSSGRADAASGSGGPWASSGPPFRSCELYDPEEPTTDGKYGNTGRADFSAGTQGIVGHPQPSAGETSRTPMALQPHQRNDFNGVTPSHLPHHCTICDKKIFNLTDWDHHVNGKLHLQNCSLYTDSPFGGSVHFPPFSAGCFSSSTNTSMSFSSAGQDISLAPNPMYLSTAPMKTQDLTGNGSPQAGSKFPQRKPHLSSRVVHICNLPEGSCTENDVINLGLPFGKVTNYILMRSTHQAFLEMAFVEAAQAMVQYYQLNPATINDQKLLIRISKRYQELQLKKPGKDVESIIQDINSQREREELPAGAGQVSQPHPSHPEPAAPPQSRLRLLRLRPQPRGVPGERPNGAGAPWDWSPRGRWEEEREEACWRNEDPLGEGWPQDPRKPRPKGPDRWGPWAPEGRTGVRRGSRERYPRSSPQDRASPYRNKEEDFYKMADWSPRPHHQHSEGRAKRRDGEGPHRARLTASGSPEVSARTPDDRKLGSPIRGWSRKQRPNQEIRNQEEEESLVKVEASVEQPVEEQSASPRRRTPDVDGAESGRDTDSEREERGNDSEIEEESWYPQNMEELVTVDEVGEEDDDIIEPDLPELQEKPAVLNVAVGDALAVDDGGAGREAVQDGDVLEESVKPPPQERVEEMSEEHPKDQTPVSPLMLEEPCSDRSSVLSQDLVAVSEEPRPGSGTADLQPPQDCLPNHEDSKPLDTPVSCVTKEFAQITKATEKEVQDQEEHFGDIPPRDACNAPHQSSRSADADHIGLHDKAVSEHSIPLGVEFVVPRSGFFCKLCGLFYASEDVAKTAHCRSTVHYRNLQKYLALLATESLDGTPTSSADMEEPCLVPHSKSQTDDY
ncbi:hypothetical protein ANANG_G00298130 [Anguilla anguilla]|uniref:Matrin-type domain-containing protein n=1 Tax=Anguilla anguilla TaxID=7936 RepID=A0A9D3LIV3_ANGAN|nr:hypothetical protein ANANG_G00298130 [Anguilla anguilla]